MNATSPNRDQQDLKLLAIFHYVAGGLAALVALFPVIHLAMGLLLLLAPEKIESDGDVPPAWVGWIFIIVAASIIAVGWAFALSLVAAGRSLVRRRHYTYCLVIAGISCMFMPLGTILGVLTLLVLSRPSVKAAFQRPADIKAAQI